MDQWAEILTLRDWYRWTDGNPANDRPTRVEPRLGDGATPEAPDPLTAAEEAAATMYLLAALDWAATRSAQEVATVGTRAAMIGQAGIRFHDPDSRYVLPGYREEPISGLQLLATMYALIQQVMPGVDQGIDLEGPYAVARQLFEARQQRPDDLG